MKKPEAIKAMRKGLRVTHDLFDNKEWITMKGDLIELEDGYDCTEEEFWKYRTGPLWDDGYSIYKEI